MALSEVLLVVGHDDPMPILSIPIEDLNRLALRPLKWLRFAMYAICGAPGRVCRTSDSDEHEVDYDSEKLADTNVKFLYRGR